MGLAKGQGFLKQPRCSSPPPPAPTWKRTASLIAPTTAEKSAGATVSTEQNPQRPFSQEARTPTWNRTASLMAPRCTGRCGALATREPSGPNSAQEKSSRSLMLTDTEVRWGEGGRETWRKAVISGRDRELSHERRRNGRQDGRAGDCL